MATEFSATSTVIAAVAAGVPPEFVDPVSFAEYAAGAAPAWRR